MSANLLSPFFAVCLYMFKLAPVGRMDLTVLQLKDFKIENFQLRRVKVYDFTEGGSPRQ